MIKSKIKTWVFFYSAFLLSSALFALWLICKGITIQSWLSAGVGAYLLGALLIILRDIKHITINNDRLRVFSLYHPFGKHYDLNRYTAKIMSQETSIQRTYPTAYLVDGTMHTAVKINGLVYRNFEELYTAVSLPEIKNYHFSIGKYLLLLFTGRIKIEKKTSKNNSQQKIR